MNVKKCPSSIRRWDSNSQPCDYESPPLTTRPGLFYFQVGTLLAAAVCQFRTPKLDYVS